MRDQDSLVIQLRDILLNLNESKTAQFVGNSQIIVKEFISDEITVTSESDGYTSEAYASCKVDAPQIADGNILITYGIPEVYTPSNNLIDNKNAVQYTVHTTTIDTKNDKTNGFQASIYHTSVGGETVPVETYRVKFHVFSAALVTLTATGGAYA